MKKSESGKLEDRMEQISQTAKLYGNRISYRVLVDTLKDKNSEITDKEIQAALDRIQGEGIEVVMKDEECGEEDYGDDDKADSPGFIPADVNITPRNITVDSILDRLEHGEINMSPEFQRRGGLWTKAQQSRLIESLMLKIPLPTFYFDASNEDEWIVIDGLQRLTAFRNFMVLKTLELEGMEYLKEFNGYSFGKLPRQYYRRIKETQITIYTVEKGTPDDIVFNIFKRINTGGLVLTQQEIRHALYQGPVTELIGRLVQEESFKTATGNSLSGERMADREYVTRFIAFTELDYSKDYTGNIDSFLTKALKKVNGYQPDEQKKECERIRCSFVRIMEYCYKIFGKYTFRRVNGSYRRGPINKAVFELWAICFHELGDEELDALVEKKEMVLERFVELLSDDDYASAIRSGDKYSLESRVNRTKKMLGEILNGESY